MRRPKTEAKITCKTFFLQCKKGPKKKSLRWKKKRKDKKRNKEKNCVKSRSTHPNSHTRSPSTLGPEIKEIVKTLPTHHPGSSKYKYYTTPNLTLLPHIPLPHATPLHHHAPPPPLHTLLHRASERVGLPPHKPNDPVHAARESRAQQRSDPVDPMVLQKPI